MTDLDTDNKFGESIVILATFQTRINAARQTMETLIHSDDAKWTCQSYIFILIAGLKEEWSRFSGMAKNSDEGRRTLKLTSTALTRVRRWKGLEEFRNTVLAHSMREKNAARSPTDLRKILEKGIPSFMETVLIAQLAEIAILTVIHRHHLHYQAALSLRKERTTDPVSFGIDTRSEFVAEVNAVLHTLRGEDPQLESKFPFLSS